MQILITHSGVSKTQVLHFNRWQLLAVALLARGRDHAVLGRDLQLCVPEGRA